MVISFTWGVVNLEFHATESKLIFLVKQYRRLNLCCIVAWPGLIHSRTQIAAKLSSIARRIKSSQARLIVHKLDVVSLRDDLRSRLLPQRHAANVISMPVR